MRIYAHILDVDLRCNNFFKKKVIARQFTLQDFWPFLLVINQKKKKITFRKRKDIRLDSISIKSRKSFYRITSQPIFLPFIPLCWLVARTITSDRTVHDNSSPSFSFELVGTISLDRNYKKNQFISFVLPWLRLDVLETEKMLQFGRKNSRHWRGTLFNYLAFQTFKFVF